MPPTAEEPFPRPRLAGRHPPPIRRAVACRPELRVSVEQDCLRGRPTPEGRKIFAERRPPRMGLNTAASNFHLIQPRSSWHGFPPRGGRRAVSLGTTPDESFLRLGRAVQAFRRQEGYIRLKIRDAMRRLQGRGELIQRLPFFLSSRVLAFSCLNSHTALEDHRRDGYWRSS